MPEARQEVLEEGDDMTREELYNEVTKLAEKLCPIHNTSAIGILYTLAGCISANTDREMGLFLLPFCKQQIDSTAKEIQDRMRTIAESN